jgi:HAD superfamily hydrolase (TIGR01544 family)
MSKEKKPNQNIHYANKDLFEKKIKEFALAYSKNKNSVAVVTDFDYTITTPIDYKTGAEYKSSYYLYDEDLIGGDQKKFSERRKALADIYSKYEFSTAYDLETRNEKMKEWYTKNIYLYFNEKFTLDSIDQMVEKCKNNIMFRNHAKQYIELLLSMGVPIIIESGGITQFIMAIMKKIFPNIQQLMDEKKIMIVSNSFTFDEKTKGCNGLEHEVIYCFNKDEFLGNVVNKEFPELKHVLVLGDNLGDADSVKKINVPKENVIGFGFVNLSNDILNDENKKEYVDNRIKEYNNAFDVALVGDCDYEPIIDILNKIKNGNK